MPNADDSTMVPPIQPPQDSPEENTPNDPAIELRKENQELRAGWQRAVADYQNLQRDVETQKKDWAVWSELRILQEFIPIYDNFKKAFNTDSGTMSKEQESWKMGIKYIMKQFGDILKTHDIEEIKTVGELFDPALHESVGEETSDAPEHSIVREIDGGYMLKGKVIKVARVIVGKKPE